MRLGILSDIHANYEALISAWGALSSASCDKIVCAGDVVGYGAKPRECVDFVRERGIETVRGNHDHYVAFPEQGGEVQLYAYEALMWTRNALDAERIEWLSKLPFKIDFDCGVSVVHASFETRDGQYWPYILDTKAALFHFYLQRVRYAIFGHTHIPLLFQCDGMTKVEMEMLRTKRLDAPPSAKYLINPGSVGQPRDFDCRSSAIVLDTDAGEVTVLRSSYDVPKVQEQIMKAGLPAILAARLSRGS